MRKIWASTGINYTAADKLKEAMFSLREAPPLHQKPLKAIMRDYADGSAKLDGAIGKLAVIEGTIIRRKKTYPDLVDSGSMTFEVAATRLDIIRAIARDYRAIVSRAK